MNDHIEQMEDAVTTAANLGRRPKRISVVHYGPDGARVATTGKASYGASTGAGSSLTYDSALAGGTPHGSSRVSLDAGGRATHATTTLLKADGTVRCHVAADYGGLSLNQAGFPTTGSAKLSVSNADKAPIQESEMEYAKERYDTYRTTSYDPKDSRTVLGRVQVKYGNATILGNKVIGGALHISHYDQNERLANRTISNLTRAGVPTSASAINFASDGTTPKQLVNSDYAGILFDARRKVRDGQLLIATHAPTGDIQHQTVLTYKQGKLIGRAPLRAGQVIQQVAFTAPPVPGPWRPDTSSDHTTEIKRADGTLLQLRRTWVVSKTADPQIPRRTITTGYGLDGTTVVRITDVDYSGATFDTKGMPSGGTVVSTQFVGGVRSSITHVDY